MIWNEDALRTTWEAARRSEQNCCVQGAVGIQHMAMAPRFVTEAFGIPYSKEFRFQLLTCGVCRCGIGVIPENGCKMRDVPWGPPHVNVPECKCEPLSDNADDDDLVVSRMVLKMLLAH